jgi:predicted ester cyclase
VVRGGSKKAAFDNYFTNQPAPEIIREIQEAKNPTMVLFEKYFKPHFEGLFAPDFISHMSGKDTNREQTLQVNLGLMTAFPDVSFGIDKMLAEGDSVVVRGRMAGTHLGSYNGIPATGKKVEIGYIIIYRVSGGKIVEAWANMDMLSLMQQLGVIPKQ